MMRCLKTISRDNARTPVQWDDSDNGGFTTGIPWIKVNPNYREINARAELADSDSVFHYYRKLIALRKQHDIIVYGAFVGRLEDSGSVMPMSATARADGFWLPAILRTRPFPVMRRRSFPALRS